jgi:hypothetical protein
VKYREVLGGAGTFLLTIGRDLAYAGEVKTALRVVWLFFLIFFVSGWLWAENDPDPLSLLRPAFQKMDQAKGAHTRFTFLDLDHNMNFNQKGKKNADETYLYDVTYVGDLQYSRLLEIDGKPLTGKQLAQEQERYDVAVREHSALDDAARAKIVHQAMKNFGFSLSLSELSAKYQNTIAGHPKSDVCDCVIIDSTPLPGAPQRRYRFWVDPAKEEVMTIETTVLADEGNKLKGSRFSLQYIYFGGIPLVSHSHFDATLLMGKKRVHVVTDHTYSHFRKFSVTTTIVPVESEGKN